MIDRQVIGSIIDTMSGDILRPIPDSDLPKLLELLRQQLPVSTVVYHWIDKQVAWSNKIPGLKLHIYGLNGEWQHGIVVAFTDGLASEGRQYGVVYAPEGEGDRKLAEALLQTRVIPWKTMMHFSGVLERHIGAVKAAAEAAGVTLPPPQPLSTLLYCPKEFAVQLPLLEPQVPNSRVSRLTKDHLEEVWELRHVFCDSMKPVIGASLEHNHAFGVFVREADGSERLVSMAMEMEHGGVGMGETHPDFRRKGLSLTLGGHVMRAMGEDGKSPTAFTCQPAILQGSKKVGMRAVSNIVRFDINPGNFYMMASL